MFLHFIQKNVYYITKINIHMYVCFNGLIYFLSHILRIG